MRFWFRDKRERPELIRLCVKCGHTHWTRLKYQRPFFFAYDKHKDVLVYQCPRCSYKFDECCLDDRSRARPSPPKPKNVRDGRVPERVL